MGLIISGFPGTGKSFHTAQLILDGYTVSDSDSSGWAKDASWPASYIAHIKQRASTHDAVFVSTHKEVRQGLLDADLPYYLVYPTRDQKSDYLERYKLRGASDSFVALMDAKWDEFLSDLENQGGRPCTHIVLSRGQYISDVMIRARLGGLRIAYQRRQPLLRTC